MFVLKLMEQIPFFAEFTPAERQRLAETDSFFENFAPGETLIREGAGDSNLFIIIKGQVRVCKGLDCAVELVRLEPGAVLGEISFLTRRARTTSVLAATPVTAFRIDGEAMQGLELDLQNRIKDQLILVLVGRLDDMNNALMRLARE